MFVIYKHNETNQKVQLTIYPQTSIDKQTDRIAADRKTEELQTDRQTDKQTD